MKRNETKVPGFDEIIFENRNKEYGAYDLRKRYKSALSFSILSTLALCSVLLAVLFFKPENGTASSVPEIVVIAVMDNLNPEITVPPEVKLPKELMKPMQNIAPEVVTDTSAVTAFIPTADEINLNTTDGNINDIFTVNEIPDEIIPAETKPFIIVEEMPEFPGGDAALLEFISKNTIYPDEAIKNNIQGRVILKFVVNSDGSVGTIELLRSVDPLLDQEAIRVVGTIPKFRPGKQGGVSVPVWYSVPVLFRIEN